jgi:hypothetical protein
MSGSAIPKAESSPLGGEKKSAAALVSSIILSTRNPIALQVD